MCEQVGNPILHKINFLDIHLKEKDEKILISSADIIIQHGLLSDEKISYLKERSENNTKWLDELINEIEDMKNKLTASA